MKTLPGFSALGLTVTASLILTTSALAFSLPRQSANRGSSSDNVSQAASNNGSNQALGGSTGGAPQATAARQEAQGRLQDAKLRACQARENAVKTRSTHLTQLATMMESKFATIAQRVEDYYTNKVVPSGKTVPNYAGLTKDIQTKKAAVDAALSSAVADAANFSCTSNDPKGQMTQYRVDMQGIIKALKDYRTSIKNLIVAVRSVVGKANSTQNQASNSARQGGASK